MTDQHNFLITNFDAHTVDLEPYQYAGTNITGFRLVDPENEILKKFAEDLTKPAEESEEKKEGEGETKKEESEERDKEEDGEEQEKDGKSSDAEINVTTPSAEEGSLIPYNNFCC